MRYEFWAKLIIASFSLVTSACHSYPDRVYYPEEDAFPQGKLENALKACIDSLATRRSAVKAGSVYQDVMVLLGGAVSAAGGVTAAALSQSDASATPTTVSASIAALGALAALASKLGSDPSADTAIHAHKRKHYDVGMAVYNQYDDNSKIPADIKVFIIDRFTSCSSTDPVADPPAAPAAPRVTQ
jgi:hypothetical protein